MYFLIILTGIIFISIFNYRVMGVESLFALFLCTFLTIVVVAQDGLFAFIIRRLPNKYFDETKNIHNPSKFERKLYEKLGVRNWKDHVPELGGFTDFHKDKIRDANNPEYLKRFILECNYGAIIHLFTAFSGLLIILIVPFKYSFTFALPVALFNFVLNLMPYMILRYNVPRLKSLLKLAIRKQNKR